MKTKALLYTLLISGGIIISSFVLYPSGSPGGRTGSTGDGGPIARVVIQEPHNK